MKMLPADFIRQMHRDHPEEAAGLLDALQNAPVISVRYNRQKAKNTISDDVVPWCDMGRYLSDRPSFTNDPLFHAGHYYVQEASSMIIDYVIRNLQLDAKPLHALDLCAAPGGKTTTLLDALHPDSFLVANDVHPKRVHLLKEYVAKWGAANTLVTNNYAAHFGRQGGVFDLVLVDAPCSGEGLFRKNEDAFLHWNDGAVLACHQRQTDILKDVAPAVKLGGHLIYSTCTFNKMENIRTLEWFLKENNWDVVQLPQVESLGIRKIDNMGYQCFPHLVRGEGFFFSVLRKREAGTRKINPKPKKRPLRQLVRKAKNTETIGFEVTSELKLGLFDDYLIAYPDNDLFNMLDDEFNVKKWGLRIGKYFKGKLTPHHDWALSASHDPPYHHESLSFDSALEYLRGRPGAPSQTASDWFLCTYNDCILGWAKNVGKRSNNYYPKYYRIRQNGVST